MVIVQVTVVQTSAYEGGDPNMTVHQHIGMLCTDL